MNITTALLLLDDYAAIDPKKHSAMDEVRAHIASLEAENETSMRERERIGNLCGEKSKEIESLRDEVERLNKVSVAIRKEQRAEVEGLRALVGKLERQRTRAVHEMRIANGGRDDCASRAEKAERRGDELHLELIALTATGFHMAQEFEEAESRIVKLERVLTDIAYGNINKANGGPDIMEMDKDDFRHAMWTWSQKQARAALSAPQPVAADAKEGE